eukprot:UN15541
MPVTWVLNPYSRDTTRSILTCGSVHKWCFNYRWHVAFVYHLLFDSRVPPAGEYDIHMWFIYV